MKHALVPWAGFLLASTAALAQPQITFQSTTTAQATVVPGGAVVWFGGAHFRDTYLERIFHWGFVEADGDKDGIVAFTRADGIPPGAVLVAVDVATGEVAVAREGGLEWGAVALAGTDQERGSDGSLVAVRLASRSADLLVVRPGVGAWAAHVADGDSRDVDGPGNATVVVSVDSLVRLDPAYAPLTATMNGDVVVLFNPQTLQYSILLVESESEG